MVENFDLNFFRDSVEIGIFENCPIIVNNRTRHTISWPVTVALSPESSRIKWSLDPSTKRLIVGGYGFMNRKLQQPILVPLIARSTSEGGSTLLKWNINETVFLKVADNAGFVSLPSNIWTDILNRYARSTVVTSSSIATYLRSMGVYEENMILEIAQVCMAFLGGSKGTRTHNLYTSPMYLTRADEETLPTTSAPNHSQCGPTIIEHPNVAPAKCISSDLGAIQDRIYNVSPLNVTIAADILAFVDEFSVQMNTNYAGSQRQVLATVKPMTFEEVLADQRTAKTRDRIREAIEELGFTFETPTVDAFVKNETYTAPKKIRNISAVCPQHNLNGFRFGLVIKKERLKRLPFYYPGKAPSELVDSLNDYLVNTELPRGFKRGCLLEGDYSSFDGTQCKPVRMLAFNIMRSCLDDKNEWDEMITQHFDAVCRSATGIRYDTLGSMLSGAWCTTDANTILNGFVVYSALRRLGMTPRASMYHIGACFGDDSLFYDVINEATGAQLSKVVVEVASCLGLKLELETRSNMFSFLSTWYQVGPSGIEGSICNLPRMLTKFQHIAKKEATTQDFAAKFSSLLLLTGDYTPILSPYLRKWFHFNGQATMDAEQLAGSEHLPYWLQISDELLTMLPPPTQELVDFIMELTATTLLVDRSSLDKMDALIRSSDSIEELNKLYISRDEASANADFVLIGDEFAIVKARALLKPKLVDGKIVKLGPTKRDKVPKLTTTEVVKVNDTPAARRQHIENVRKNEQKRPSDKTLNCKAREPTRVQTNVKLSGKTLNCKARDQTRVQSNVKPGWKPRNTITSAK